MKRFLAMLLTVLLILPVHAADLQLPAPSAILMDVPTGAVLYESNADEPLAPASVTKVMTLLLILEALDSGKIQWTDTVTASESAAAKGGSQVYLKVGETMTVEEMVKSIAVSSANDCACAMAEFLSGSEVGFVEDMNEKAAELGMEHTHFANCTGLDDEAGPEVHYSTARDIAAMSRELLKHHPVIRKFSTIWMDTVRNGSFGLTNTNKLVRFYKGTTGLKTGYTSHAGHCLSASAERDGLELIAVVLNCKSSGDRFQSAKALLDYGFANYGLCSLDTAELSPVPVILGTRDSIRPIPAGPTEVLLDKDRQKIAKQSLELLESVEAPVVPGQQLGILKLTADGRTLSELPLVAPDGVPRLTFGQIFHKLLGRLCMA